MFWWRRKSGRGEGRDLEKGTRRSRRSSPKSRSERTESFWCCCLPTRIETRSYSDARTPPPGPRPSRKKRSPRSSSKAGRTKRSHSEKRPSDVQPESAPHNDGSVPPYQYPETSQQWQYAEGGDPQYPARCSPSPQEIELPPLIVTAEPSPVFSYFRNFCRPNVTVPPPVQVENQTFDHDQSTSFEMRGAIVPQYEENTNNHKLTPMEEPEDLQLGYLDNEVRAPESTSGSERTIQLRYDPPAIPQTDDGRRRANASSRSSSVSRTGRRHGPSPYDRNNNYSGTTAGSISDLSHSIKDDGQMPDILPPLPLSPLEELIHSSETSAKAPSKTSTKGQQESRPYTYRLLRRFTDEKEPATPIKVSTITKISDKAEPNVFDFAVAASTIVSSSEETASNITQTVLGPAVNQIPEFPSPPKSKFTHTAPFTPGTSAPPVVIPARTTQAAVRASAKRHSPSSSDSEGSASLPVLPKPTDESQHRTGRKASRYQRRPSDDPDRTHTEVRTDAVLSSTSIPSSNLSSSQTSLEGTNQRNAASSGSGSGPGSGSGSGSSTITPSRARRYAPNYSVDRTEVIPGSASYSSPKRSRSSHGRPDSVVLPERHSSGRPSIASSRDSSFLIRSDHESALHPLRLPVADPYVERSSLPSDLTTGPPTPPPVEPVGPPPRLGPFPPAATPQARMNVPFNSPQQFPYMENRHPVTKSSESEVSASTKGWISVRPPPPPIHDAYPQVPDTPSTFLTNAGDVHTRPGSFITAKRRAGMLDPRQYVVPESSTGTNSSTASTTGGTAPVRVAPKIDTVSPESSISSSSTDTSFSPLPQLSGIRPRASQEALSELLRKEDDLSSTAPVISPSPELPTRSRPPPPRRPSFLQRLTGLGDGHNSTASETSDSTVPRTPVFQRTPKVRTNSRPTPIIRSHSGSSRVPQSSQPTTNAGRSISTSFTLRNADSESSNSESSSTSSSSESSIKIPKPQPPHRPPPLILRHNSVSTTTTTTSTNTEPPRPSLPVRTVSQNNPRIRPRPAPIQLLRPPTRPPLRIPIPPPSPSTPSSVSSASTVLPSSKATMSPYPPLPSSGPESVMSSDSTSTMSGLGRDKTMSPPKTIGELVSGRGGNGKVPALSAERGYVRPTCETVIDSEDGRIRRDFNGGGNANGDAVCTRALTEL